jgi:hypothetical protein
MLEYIKYLLFCYGFTAIFMYGAIAEPIRNLITWGPFKKMTTCAMCLGFWVGCFFHILFFPATPIPFTVANIPFVFIFGIFTMGHGIISSGVTWFLCTVTQFAAWGKAYYEYQFMIEKARADALEKTKKEVELHG